MAKPVGPKSHRKGGKAKKERPVTQEPVRMCVVTREPYEASQLIRLAVSPEGEAVVDYHGKLSGRGAWVYPEKERLLKLEKHPGLLAKALEVESLRTEGLLEQVRVANHKHTLDLLSLAARAGLIASGADQLEDAVRGGQVSCVIAAADASPRSVEALQSLIASREVAVPLYASSLDKEALGHQIGKGPRALVGLRPANLTKALQLQLQRAGSLR